ncbi:DUF4232 domain-containing protein [Actinomadura barringtoniae]|uniref:DUF4232 domain-containing protein n=1 Tax=Actinomadura barringtoniae TaxID=1427535 RepID=A0A939T579_9ACTN|nr:DUF4232 domain-containing protein [Actinomadura barringtoniae]MBO2450308.1 DUF4232 domain-containing protein [Actinomadura barringtoniae]
MDSSGDEVKRTTTWGASALALLGIAMGLTACGGSGDATPVSNATSGPTGPQMRPGSGTVTPTPPTSLPTGTYDPKKVAEGTACTWLANQITAAVQDPVDRGASREYPILLTEESATSCSLVGLATVTLLDTAGHTVATAKPGAATQPTLLTPDKPIRFTLTTPRAGASTEAAAVQITLPHGGGTRKVDAHGMTVAPNAVVVGGFAPQT